MSDAVSGALRECHAKRADGTVFEAEMRLSTFAVGGAQHYVAVIRDITERKELDRLKDEFVSTVSHELRTPLTSIRGALGLLEAGVAGPLEAAGLEMVRIARTNSERLVRLINDILDLEKIEAGKLELTLTTLDPVQLARAALEQLQTMTAESGVSLTLAAEPVARVRGDEDRLMQVLTNLLSNAIKFSPQGAKVVVRVTPLPTAVRFCVCDEGPGIAARDLKRLFGKFQQLDGSDTRQRRGTGLGLAISKAIVEQHGGRIGVESALGVGSTFWFELPLRGS